MKVLAAIVVPPHLSASGGARAGELLSAALASHCDVTVASMMNGVGLSDAPSEGGVDRVRVESRAPVLLSTSVLPNKARTLFYRSSIPDLIRDGDFDLVHIHNPMPALEMARVARACRSRGVPYVVSTHGFNEVAHGGGAYGFSGLKSLVWKSLVEKPVAEVVAGAAGVFALSPADFAIVRAMGFTGDELTIVSNGAPEPTVLEPAVCADALARFGIPSERAPDQVVCAFLANHTPNKGLPVLLEAFAGLERPFLLIVGGETRAGVDYDAAVRNCGPDQKIVVTGRLSDTEVAAMFQRADLFVFPTFADTFPLVVLEAMGHGTPVVSTRVGGIPHQVSEGCGALVEPGDVEGLRRTIDRLADDPEGLSEMGRRARQRVRSEFTWARAAEEAATSYRRILEGAGATAPSGSEARRAQVA